ncbi:chaperonin 10-like protein [Truncatella angustata]|uniref:Chaperonin 10-like protein n=1 Tax=Truncatella angustata TaxID=152316 RepID=A0A9P8UB73_9PEZI|nr:chaperonin 10-like protein [Truncatella angustata]KAH6645632.1 chaperonin 10-like protein [Truncatella angustata]
MKALVYNGVDNVLIEEKPKPNIKTSTDAIIKMDYTTICGTDLHIVKGDVLDVRPGTVLGHEGVGRVVETGSGISMLNLDDRVLISCISACGICEYCRKGMYSHCVTGGWLLGHTIDGTQAEYVRIPHADTSLHKIPTGMNPKTATMLSDILPTGLECGVINGKVQPGNTIAIIGAGPVGLSALLMSQLYSPSWVLMIDSDQYRLRMATELGAQHTAEPAEASAVVEKLTTGVGCDTVIEAVGNSVAFEKCQRLVAPGGNIANVGVHGKEATLHLEDLWASNISITTGLVDTTTIPMLLKLCAAGRWPIEKLISHYFKFSGILQAYETFKEASSNEALKVLVEME